MANIEDVLKTRIVPQVDQLKSDVESFNHMQKWRKGHTLTESQKSRIEGERGDLIGRAKVLLGEVEESDAQPDALGMPRKLKPQPGEPNISFGKNPILYRPQQPDAKGSTVQNTLQQSPGMVAPAAAVQQQPVVPASSMQNYYDQFNQQNNTSLGFAGGGPIRGPKGDDRVPGMMPDGDPARLQNGEYVLPVEAVEVLGGQPSLDAFVALVTGKMAGPTEKPPLPGQVVEQTPTSDAHKRGGKVKSYRGGGELEKSAVDQYGIRRFGTQGRELARQELGLPGVEQSPAAAGEFFTNPEAIANLHAKRDYNLFREKTTPAPRYKPNPPQVVAPKQRTGIAPTQPAPTQAAPASAPARPTRSREGIFYEGPTGSFGDSPTGIGNVDMSLANARLRELSGGKQGAFLGGAPAGLRASTLPNYGPTDHDRIMASIEANASLAAARKLADMKPSERGRLSPSEIVGTQYRDILSAKQQQPQVSGQQPDLRDMLGVLNYNRNLAKDARDVEQDRLKNLGDQSGTFVHGLEERYPWMVGKGQEFYSTLAQSPQVTSGAQVGALVARALGDLNQQAKEGQMTEVSYAGKPLSVADLLAVLDGTFKVGDAKDLEKLRAEANMVVLQHIMGALQ